VSKGDRMQLKGQYFWQASMSVPMKIKEFSQEKGMITSFELENIPKGEKIKELILPTFSNLHCHLELGFLKGKLDAGKPFPEWVGQLRKYSKYRELADYKHSVFQGVKDSLASGVSNLLDVGNSEANLKFAKYSPVRIYSSLELLGIDPKMLEPIQERATQSLKKHPVKKGSQSQLGLSAHAPFSCSIPLIQYVNTHNKKSGFPHTIHLSESQEEKELFASGKGKLSRFLSFIYPDWSFKSPKGQNFENSIDYMLAHDLIEPGSILVHLNHSTPQQLQKLKELNCTVVYCPGSCEFFGHQKPDIKAWKKAGLNICLGSDSLASNDSLNMWKELKQACEYSELKFNEVFEMLTVNSSKALNKSEIGFLGCGSFCDFQKLELQSEVSQMNLGEALENQNFKVVETVIGGITRWIRPK
jgi:aminodeoxyfutalosine deaminase